MDNHADTTQSQSAPMLEEFKWTYVPERSTVPGYMAADFAGQVQDMTRGLAIVLGMIEQDELAETSADEDGNPLPKLLDSVSAGYLQRLCISGLKLLGDQAESHAKTVKEMAERSVQPRH